jgi:ATP-dependent helicase/nuclease subunit A
MQLTIEQQAIVDAPLSDLLVSAAAGSGKTAVMTERIVRRIVDGTLEINTVLVMTFTEAAARQMKAKIASKLETARREAGSAQLAQRLVRQQTLLPGSAISTIHAFCLTVVRNFCQLALDDKGKPLVDPAFSVLDPQMADLMLAETLDQVLADRYETLDRLQGLQQPAWATAFFRLVDSYGSSRGDDPLRLQISQFYRYLRSLPDYPQKVAAYQAGLEAAAADFAASEPARILLGQLRLLLDQALAALPTVRDLLDSGVLLAKKPERNAELQASFHLLDCVLQEIDRLLRIEPAPWDRLVELAGQLKDLDWPDKRGKNHDPGKLELIELFRRELSECLHVLTGDCGSATYRSFFRLTSHCLFDRPTARIEQDIRDMLPALGQFFELTLALDAAYRDQKRILSTIDFSDFEHLALMILRQPEAAAYYRGRYSEIYIDEYQDTSSIQDALLQAIGQDNCFMVGDVKQSIYRFRHARPQLFIARSSQYHEEQAGRLKVLNRNFRSVPAILTAVNQVFAQLMSPSAGEIAYDDSQALKAGRACGTTATTPVELLLIDAAPTADSGTPEDSETSGPAAGDSDFLAQADQDLALQGGDLAAELSADPMDVAADLESLNSYEKEAWVVRHRISHLLNEGVHPGDIVVLARSRAIVRTFAQALRALEIPVAEDSGQAFLDSPALRLIHALLQMMDNPLQDVPLAAVMRSSLFEGGFEPVDLYAIRTAAAQLGKGQRPVFFHEAVHWYTTGGPDEALRERLDRFWKWVRVWRDQEKTLKVAEWLQQLLDETRFLTQVSATVDGAAKVGEIQAFVRWIGSLERHRPRGLFDVVRQLEKMVRLGTVESPFALETSDRQAVRVMTIHRSKGLEYPIVFVVGMASDLSPKDSRQPLMYSEQLGVGFDWVDPDQHLSYPTHVKLAMVEASKAAALAEELRLLYVAMTRAKDRLHLTAALPRNGRAQLIRRLADAWACQDQALPPHLVLGCHRYLDWLVLALARQEGLDWRGLDPDASPPAGDSDSSVWQLTIAPLEDLLSLGVDVSSVNKTVSLEDSSVQDFTWLSPAPEPAWKTDPAWQTQVQQIKDQIDCDYRFDSAARSPVKLSVSELKRLEQHENAFGSEQSLTLAPAAQTTPLGINLALRPLSDIQENPASSDGAPLSGAARGTAVHSFLRYLDWSRLGGSLDDAASQLDDQLAELTAAGVFGPAEQATVHETLADLAFFAASPLAARLKAAQSDSTRVRRLYREMPFTLALAAQAVWPAEAGFAPDDRVLVQGIIDAWFVENGRAVLVDYKTDHLFGPPDAVRLALASRYWRQLAYYARAIEAATRLPIEEAVIVHVPSRQVFSGTTEDWRVWAATAPCEPTGDRRSDLANTGSGGFQ